MSTETKAVELSGPAVQLGAVRQASGFALFVGAGALLAAAGISLTRGAVGLQYFIPSYLTSYAFFLAPTLGALFFVIIHHLVRAGWSVSVRRVAETLASNVLVMGALSVPILGYAYAS